jgi:MFS family permease
MARNFPMILCSAALVGMGSSIFHPEASRLARMASGGRRGFAQSIFQVGGNAGTSFGPLLAALIIVPRGQYSVAWFSGVALLAIVVLANVGHWYKRNLFRIKAGTRRKDRTRQPTLSRRRVALALSVLIALMFSKFIYIASMTNYYTFYLIGKYHLPLQGAQLFLFLFLFAVAAGTMIGGHLGDQFGRKYVIWASILGVAPFTLLLPYANLLWTDVLTVVIGLILGFRLFRNPRLRSGTGSRKSWDDRRPVFRLCVRNGWCWFSRPWQARRRDEHLLYLPSLLLPSVDRAADRISAQFEQRLCRSGLARNDEVGTSDTTPLLPNRTGRSPAFGSPVGGYLSRRSASRMVCLS